MDRRAQIADFFAGKLTPKQAEELLEWLDSAEGEIYLATEIDQLWTEKTKHRTKDAMDPEALWQKISAATREYPRPVALKPVVRTTKTFPVWVKVAACSIVLAGLAWLSLLNTEPPVPSPVEEVMMVTKYNPPGQKTRVHLSDGSIVILNSDSKITYPEHFEKNRRLALEGEAFFTVKKDSLHPFIVVAKDIVTTALGTSFNVSTFLRDENVRVTLVSGQVRLNREGRENHLILNPGEESVLSEKEQELHKREVDVSERTVWIDGILTFKSTPVEEVIDLLKRWYGVSIDVRGQVTPTLCSGTFRENEMLGNVLEVLSSSVGFNYKLDGKNVTIYF